MISLALHFFTKQAVTKMTTIRPNILIMLDSDRLHMKSIRHTIKRPKWALHHYE